MTLAAVLLVPPRARGPAAALLSVRHRQRPSLPMGHGNWHATDSSYDVSHLVPDTLALLTPATPVTRSHGDDSPRDNLRGGAPQAAAALFDALRARAAAPAPADAALVTFDFGYLVESFKEAKFLFKEPLSAIDRIDGYQLVLKAHALQPRCRHAAGRDVNRRGLSASDKVAEGDEERCVTLPVSPRHLASPWSRQRRQTRGMRRTHAEEPIVPHGCCAVARVAGTARADDDRSSACRDLPSHAALRAQLEAARAQPNGGFNLEMWATVVNRDGVVCAVAFTGNNRGDQWPGSRVISAQKANTANAFSLPTLALSTADLFTATQPGGSLFGLQESNPVDTGVAYGGNPGEQRSKQRSDGRRTDRRRECVRRRARAVQLQRKDRRRPWGQRRLVLRRPQHRVADASQL